MKNKKVYVILIVLILIGSIFLTYNIYQNKNKVIKTKKRKQNNLAIMIKEDGATDYTKSNSKDIPKGDYVLNYEKSYCKNNGVIGYYDNSLGKVSFSFIGTDSCYLYFDYKPGGLLYETIEKRYNQDKTYLGLYDGEGADTYANPVYYYKGNVQNNNVLFGGFCWKRVRTTETGGVKLVYNGKHKSISDDYTLLDESEYTNLNNDATYPYTFDSINKTWTSTNTGTNSSTITFTAPSNGNYVLNYDLSMYNYPNVIYVEVFKDDVSQEKFTGTTTGQIIFGDLNTTNTIKVVFTRKSSSTSGSRNNIIFSFGKTNNIVRTCNNTERDSQIGTSAFNSTNTSPAYVGYMYNTVYTYSSKSMSSESNIVFGNSFTYANGSYTLTGTKTVATWSSGYNTINNNHYTCMTTGNTCTALYYVYYAGSSTAYYITLTGGKSVNDALNEMLYANDVNKNDSTIKAYIDSWYENNIKDKYEDKLEDTIFCNDRSMSNESYNGWNPNGGKTAIILKFKNYDTSNQSLACTNETDRFSHNNAKAYLKYPIGLLSAPELILAGYGKSHYFNSGEYVWLGSPIAFVDDYATVGQVYPGGLRSTYAVIPEGVRPSLSLKPKTYFSSGNGSFTNPFVIGDAVEEPSGKSFDTVFAANNTDIFNENGLRYEGADPNNYICLDNKTEGACSNSSLLFRIIGLFDEDTSSDGTTSAGTKKLLKVIDTNNYGGTSDKMWNSVEKNNWSTASLKADLNETYLTTLLGTSNVNSKLSSGIANAKWHLGGASSSNYLTLTTEGIYTEERNASAIYSGNPEYVFAQVGLMYPSDYGYATIGGPTTNKSSCRAKELPNWKVSSYSDCKNNDWLFTSQATSWGSNEKEWLISPYSSSSNVAAYLESSGFVFLNDYPIKYSVNNGLAVRPTFYLDSSILKIVGGLGTRDNAYRIG